MEFETSQNEQKVRQAVDKTEDRLRQRVLTVQSAESSLCTACDGAGILELG